MKSKSLIHSEHAPAAIGPYSQGIAVGGFLFTSGQLPIDPATETIPTCIGEQTHQALKNLQAIAAASGATLDDVVKTTIFLSDIKDFKTVNHVYSTYFKKPFPARSTFEVACLPLGAGIEIEAILATRN